MYIVSVLSNNHDFLESLPQALLNYNAGNLKFYFFSSIEQLNQQVKQSGLPDLLLTDRHIDLGEVWEKYPINKVFLSEKGDSRDEISIYKNTSHFLLEVQRRISVWQIEKGLSKNAIVNIQEKKVTWFLDPNESEWGKDCYNIWLDSKYKNGQGLIGFDFSRMGILKGGLRCFSEHNLSDLIQSWLYKKKHALEDFAVDTQYFSKFDTIQGVKHPMDIELLKPEFIEYCIDCIGSSYGEIGIYAPLYNEGLSKSLLRYVQEIYLVSDQRDEYEEPLSQIESWLKEVNPRGKVSVYHSRNDSSHRTALKQMIKDKVEVKGGSL